MLDEPWVELDVFAVIEGLRFWLELKYLRTTLDPTISAERVALIAGASDVERYCRALRRAEGRSAPGAAPSGGGD